MCRHHACSYFSKIIYFLNFLLHLQGLGKKAQTGGGCVSFSFTGGCAGQSLATQNHVHVTRGKKTNKP